MAQAVAFGITPTRAWIAAKGNGACEGTDTADPNESMAISLAGAYAERQFAGPIDRASDGDYARAFDEADGTYGNRANAELARISAQVRVQVVWMGFAIRDIAEHLTRNGSITGARARQIYERHLGVTRIRRAA